tara:strand:- start:152 stop:484 length:333 start_codon:yes stop_codon:yes gene_type:complete
MAEAIAFHQEIGSVAIEARTLELAAVLKDTLKGISGVSLTGPDDPQLSSGLISFAVEGKEPLQVVEALWERGVACRQVQNPDAIRLCTAFFNTEDELQRVGVEVRTIAGS